MPSERSHLARRQLPHLKDVHKFVVFSHVRMENSKITGWQMEVITAER